MAKGKSKFDIYQHITDQFLALLKEGVTPWSRPWKKMGQHRNAISRRPYSGLNVFLLSLTAWEKGYDTGNWMTFNQCKKAGGSVRKGEKGTIVTFWKTFKSEETDSMGQVREVTIPFMKWFSVFNVDQCDGLPEKMSETPVQKWEDEADIDGWIEDHEAKIEFGGDRAAYSPTLDRVRIPLKVAFEDGQGFYSTIFHELIHWTGHKSRQDRFPETVQFGSPDYAFEELVAELGAAFMCSEFEVQNMERHAGYLDHWVKLLESDKKAIVRASGKAAKATRLLLGEEYTEAKKDASAA